MMEFILDRCDDGDYSIRGYPTSVVLKSERSYGYGVCKAFIKRSIGHRPKTVRVKVSTTWRFGWRRASLVTLPAHINIHLRGISISGMGDAMGLFETPIKIIEDMQQKGKLGDVFYLKFEEVKS